MRLLVCAATEMELATCPVLPEITAHVTGVGVPATFAGLRQAEPEASQFGLVVNIGIAGAYRRSNINIGDIVLVHSEVYGDVGFELPEADSHGEPGFLPLFSSAFGRPFHDHPLALRCPSVLPTQMDNLQVSFGSGCTVGTCTGTEATGERRAVLFKADVESMEGASVAQWGQSVNLPVCQIRSISNIAARRDMQPHNIKFALERLQLYLAEAMPLLTQADL